MKLEQSTAYALNMVNLHLQPCGTLTQVSIDKTAQCINFAAVEPPGS